MKLKLRRIVHKCPDTQTKFHKPFQTAKVYVNWIISIGVVAQPSESRAIDFFSFIVFRSLSVGSRSPTFVAVQQNYHEIFALFEYRVTRLVENEI